VRLLFLFSQK